MSTHSYCSLMYDEDLQAYRVILADHAGRPSRLFLHEDDMARILTDVAIDHQNRHGYGIFETDETVYVVSVFLVDGRQTIDFVTHQMWDADSRYRLLQNTKNPEIASVRLSEYENGRLNGMQDWYIDHKVNQAKAGE